MQVTLELPDDVALYLAGNDANVQRAVLEAVALEAYREKKLSTGQLRKLLGYNTRMQVHVFLKDHDVHLHYGPADLELDRKAGDALVLPVTHPAA